MHGNKYKKRPGKGDESLGKFPGGNLHWSTALAHHIGFVRRGWRRELAKSVHWLGPGALRTKANKLPSRAVWRTSCESAEAPSTQARSRCEKRRPWRITRPGWHGAILRNPRPGRSVGHFLFLLALGVWRLGPRGLLSTLLGS